MQQIAVIEEFSIEQIVPFFQPIYDLAQAKVMRYECLARLVTKDDSVYLPSEFLYIVSRSQSNALLTQRIVELSSAYCVQRNMPWSVNMFKTDLRDAALVKWLQQLFEEIPYHLAGVELSFDSVKEHPHLLSNLMQKLPNLHVTVDDVYECNSMLNEVINTGIHAVKLRGDVVTRYAKTGQGRQNIEQLLAECTNTGCALIAEHVEDNNTLDALQNIGLQYGQGFYLSEPAGRMVSLKQV